jgi:hypothetical protein
LNADDEKQELRSDLQAPSAAQQNDARLVTLLQKCPFVATAEFSDSTGSTQAVVDEESFRVLFPFVNGRLAISESGVLSCNLSLSFWPCFYALYV